VATENLAFVTHVGDVVQNGAAEPAEWTRADEAMNTLDGVLPYSVLPGNHDFDVVNSHSGDSAFTGTFGGERYTAANYPWYIGESDYRTNHAQTFTAGGQQFLHIALEWEPREGAIIWAQGLMDDPLYQGLPVILSTHSYLNTSGRPTGTTTADGYSGEEIFTTLVKPNPQVFMVLCGHVSAEYHQVSYNDAGLEVFEILADYQDRPSGGDGWMRLLEFVPGQNRINVKTYSPSLNQYEADANSQFSLNVDFDERFNFTFAPTASITTPLDNGPNDFNPTADAVTVNTTQSIFQIQLADVDDGIDDTTVLSSVLVISKDGAPLLLGTDYTFSYDAANDPITVAPLPNDHGSPCRSAVLRHRRNARVWDRNGPLHEHTGQ
jgi:hypothetical protein